MPRHRVLTLLAAGALVVAVASPADAKTDPKRDQRIARAALLEIGDFPTGWRETGEHRFSLPEGASCAAIRRVEKAAKQYLAESPEFESQTGLARNSVYVFPSRAKAKAYLKPYAATGTKCLTDSAKRDQSLQNADVSIDELDPEALIDATGSDDALIFQTEVVQGSTTYVLIQAGVRIGRAVNGFTFLNATGSVLPEAEYLVVVSLDRLGAAL